MPYFIITWDAGYGDTHAKVEAKDECEALEIAGQRWLEEAESLAEYTVEARYTEALGKEFGV
jgi:hypothetical protein